MSFAFDSKSEGTFGAVECDNQIATKRYHESKKQIVCDTLCKEIVFHTYFSNIYGGKFREIENEIVLDMEEGVCNLREYINMFNGNIDIEDLIKQLLIQIYYIHELRFLHNDISANNILVFRNNDKVSYSLIDFGLSMKIGGSAHTINNDLANLGYMFLMAMTRTTDRYYAISHKGYINLKMKKYVDLSYLLINSEKKDCDVKTILKGYFNINVSSFTVKCDIGIARESIYQIPNSFVYKQIKTILESGIATEDISKIMLYSLQMLNFLHIKKNTNNIFLTCGTLCEKMFVCNPSTGTGLFYDLELKILKDLGYRFPRYEIKGDYDKILSGMIKEYEIKTEIV